MATDGNVWEMPVGGGQAGDYVLCPAGNYAGRIVALIDIGHQSIDTRDRGLQQVRKLVLVFELALEQPDGSGPYVMAKSYTWSMRESSNLYKLVAALYGRKLQDGETFNPQQMLGCAVMVVVTNTDQGELTYSNIGGIAPFPAGFQPPTNRYPLVAWSVCSGERWPEGCEWFPILFGKTLKQLAMESAEGRRRVADLRAQAAARAGQGNGPGPRPGNVPTPAELGQRAGVYPGQMPPASAPPPRDNYGYPNPAARPPAPAPVEAPAPSAKAPATNPPAEPRRYVNPAPATSPAAPQAPASTSTGGRTPDDDDDTIPF